METKKTKRAKKTAAPEDTRGPRERAYDEHIAPLVTQMIALCQEHDIPLIVDVELDAVEDDEKDPLHCTTIIGDAKSDAQLAAIQALRPRSKVVAIAVFSASK